MHSQSIGVNRLVFHEVVNHSGDIMESEVPLSHNFKMQPKGGFQKPAIKFHKSFKIQSLSVVERRLV